MSFLEGFHIKLPTGAQMGFPTPFRLPLLDYLRGRFMSHFPKFILRSFTGVTNHII